MLTSTHLPHLVYGITVLHVFCDVLHYTNEHYVIIRRSKRVCNCVSLARDPKNGSVESIESVEDSCQSTEWTGGQVIDREGV